MTRIEYRYLNDVAFHNTVQQLARVSWDLHFTPFTIIEISMMACEVNDDRFNNERRKEVLQQPTTPQSTQAEVPPTESKFNI